MSSGRGRGQGHHGLLSLFQVRRNKDLPLNKVKKEKAFDFKHQLNYVKEKVMEKRVTLLQSQSFFKVVNPPAAEVLVGVKEGLYPCYLRSNICF